MKAIHHLNDDPNDNSISNLRVVYLPDHALTSQNYRRLFVYLLLELGLWLSLAAGIAIAVAGIIIIGGAV